MKAPTTTVTTASCLSRSVKVLGFKVFTVKPSRLTDEGHMWFGGVECYVMFVFGGAAQGKTTSATGVYRYIDRYLDR